MRQDVMKCYSASPGSPWIHITYLINSVSTSFTIFHPAVLSTVIPHVCGDLDAGTLVHHRENLPKTLLSLTTSLLPGTTKSIN